MHALPVGGMATEGPLAPAPAWPPGCRRAFPDSLALACLAASLAFRFRLCFRRGPENHPDSAQLASAFLSYCRFGQEALI